MVEFHPRFHAAPPHLPSAAWRASSLAPAPSVATRPRSAATSSADKPIRSRITCQRIEGSESSSHCMTGVCVFGPCHFGRLIAIRWPSPILSQDAIVAVNLEPNEAAQERRQLFAEQDRRTHGMEGDSVATNSGRWVKQNRGQKRRFATPSGPENLCYRELAGSAHLCSSLNRFRVSLPEGLSRVL